MTKVCGNCAKSIQHDFEGLDNAREWFCSKTCLEIVKQTKLAKSTLGYWAQSNRLRKYTAGHGGKHPIKLLLAKAFLKARGVV